MYRMSPIDAENIGENSMSVCPKSLAALAGRPQAFIGVSRS